MINFALILSTDFGNERLKALLLYMRFYNGLRTKRQSLPKEEATREEKKGEKVKE